MTAERHPPDADCGNDALDQALLTDEKTGPWETISNLDDFFAKICFGWPRTLAFTIFFSTFLLVFVNWSGLFACESEASCKTVVGIRQNVFSNPSFAEVLVFIYFALFCLYWAWNLISFLLSIRETRETATFYNDQLGFLDEDLCTIEWYTIVERLVKLHETVRLCRVKDLTALDITNRIMRKENYLIALINMNQLNLSISGFACCNPSISTTPYTYQSTAPYVTGRAACCSNTNGWVRWLMAVACQWCTGDGIFGKALEWNLRFCVLNSMFDNHLHLRKDFLDANALKRRFVLIGVVNMVFLPFVMIFMIIIFFLKNAEELHSKKSVLGPRQWTPLANWKLREFNELPHFFQRRLNLSQEPAQLYMNQFPATYSAVIAQAVSYISGSVVGLLLLLSLSDSSLILTLRVFDKTILWHLAFWSVLLGGSRSFIPTKGAIFRPQAAMAQLVKHTHYLPDHWRGRIHKREVRDEFGQLYRPRVLIFLSEVLCVLFTPALLCFSLPQCAQAIVDFVQRYTVQVIGVGPVCAFAMFDLERLGDAMYSMEQRTHMPARYPGDKKAVFGPHNDDDDASGYHPPQPDGHTLIQIDKATGRGGQLTARNGKLEKSFISFAMNHPHWRTGPDGARFLSSLAASIQQSQAQQLTKRQRIVLGDLAVSNAGLQLEGEEEDEKDEKKRTGGAVTWLELSQSTRHLASSFSDLLHMGNSATIHPTTPSSSLVGSSGEAKKDKVEENAPPFSHVLSEPLNLALSVGAGYDVLQSQGMWEDDDTAVALPNLFMLLERGYDDAKRQSISGIAI